MSELNGKVLDIGKLVENPKKTIAILNDILRELEDIEACAKECRNNIEKMKSKVGETKGN